MEQGSTPRRRAKREIPLNQKHVWTKEDCYAGGYSEQFVEDYWPALKKRGAVLLDQKREKVLQHKLIAFAEECARGNS